MAGDNIERRQGDRIAIDLSDQFEIRDWSWKLGVTELELHTAVEKVGPVAEDARRFLPGS